MRIIVNGKTHTVTSTNGRLSYHTIAHLAGRDPNQTLTVTWSTRQSQGGLTKGQDCELKDGMVINCFETGSA
jgi:hypothetical protein